MGIDNENTENSSLYGGSFFQGILVKLGLNNRPGLLALVSILISWVPLFVFTSIDGTLNGGTQLPFLKDIEMQMRLLLALPMLILIKPSIIRNLTFVTNYLSDFLAGSAESKALLNAAVVKARKYASSWWIELILLLLVIVITVSFVKGEMFNALKLGNDSWMVSSKTGSQELSFAGNWVILFSIPLFQFVLIRWLWKYIVWVLLFFRFSKIKLSLFPTHADRSGGLGILIVGQRAFNLVFVAGSIVIAGQMIGELLKDPGAFIHIRNLTIGYVVICLVVLLLPLTFFTGKLIRIKQQGLRRLSNLATDLSRQFEADWMTEIPIEKRIAERQSDPSLLYDFSGMYESVQQLRTIPATLRDVGTMAMTLLIPFIPVLFVHFSVLELLQKITKLLL